MKPCHIDGLLFVLMSLCGGLAFMFSTDDAAKYMEPKTLWLLKNIFATIGGTLLGLKQFRSTSYAEFRNKTKWMENGQDFQTQLATVKVDTTTKIQTTPEISHEKIPTNPAANTSATAPPGV